MDGIKEGGYEVYSYTIGKSGSILYRPIEVLESWTEYFNANNVNDRAPDIPPWQCLLDETKQKFYKG